MLVRLWLGYILVVLPVFRLPYIIVPVLISAALMSGTKSNFCALVGVNDQSKPLKMHVSQKLQLLCTGTVS